jgi:3'-phosphoadenosine 5'-phosphosulfate sulfotransferase (PAPS reductase)/FAD synthetase
MSEPDLKSYQRILVMFSGGKDSLACVLHLLDQGVDKALIELWHHDVDGGSRFMDWPCTTAYSRVVAKHLGIPIYFSWREGGFLREMMRDGDPTAPTRFEKPDGSMGVKGGAGKPGRRLQFPQVSADLSVRWCSAYLKIDVASIAIKNQERFQGIRTLFITGERALESAARAHYKVFEPHRTDARAGDLRRHIDHWRPIHAWTEKQVWEIVEKHGINPHPAYRLGWGRVSCFSCIFGSANQWSSIRKIAPDWFARVAGYERQFGKTIQRGRTISELADRGTPYPAVSDSSVVAEAMDENWSGSAILSPWKLPAGAFGENAGPT